MENSTTQKLVDSIESIRDELWIDAGDQMYSNGYRNCCSHVAKQLDEAVERFKKSRERLTKK